MGNTEFTSQLGKDQLDSMSSQKLDLSRRLTPEELDQHLKNGNVTSGSALVEIPARIFAQVSFYETLIVAFHCISRIPQQLPMQLPHLVHLNLNFNQITNLPESFGLLIHLEILELSHNLLTNLPSSFALLKSLKKLDLSSNKLIILRKDLGKLLQLKKLNIANNYLESLPMSLCLIDSLEVVVASHNSLMVPPQDVCDKGLQCIQEFFADKNPRSSPNHGHVFNIFPRVKKGDVFSHPNLNTAMTQYTQMQSESFNMKVKVKTPLLPPSTATSLPPDELGDRIIGCIYGAAIGNAIGLSTDFMSKDECEFYYDKESISYEDMINDVRRNNLKRGCWSDAFDQMILVLDSILSWGGVVDELDFARRLKSWNKNGFPEVGDTEGPDVKGLLGKIIANEEFTKDPHFVAKMISHENEYFSNGAVMRTAVLGIPHFHDLDEVCANTVRICKSTHADSRCIASCVAVCTIIALLLQGKHDLGNNRSLDEILSEALGRAERHITDIVHVNELKKYMICKDFESVLCNEAGINHTFKPLGAAVAGLRLTEQTFQSSITELIFQGGYSSCNAAVAGAVLGCKTGYRMLPKNWINGLCRTRSRWLNSKINCFLNMMGLP